MTLTLTHHSPLARAVPHTSRPPQVTAVDLWDLDASAVAGRMSTCALTMETFFQASHNSGAGKWGKRATNVFRVQLACSFSRINPEGPLPTQLVRERLDTLAKRYVGQHLNDLPPFQGKGPTPEHLAAVIFCQLERLLGDLPLTIDAVTVYESPTQAATCRQTA